MTDLILASVGLVTALLLAAGVWLGYKIARMFDRPPKGWVLVDIGFGIALIRILYLLYVALAPPSGEDLTTLWVNNVLNLVTALFILPGVYYMYTDFKRQLREKQANLLVS